MRVLYLSGSSSDAGEGTVQQLMAVAADLQITTVKNPADALVEIRKPPAWQALLVSPALAQNETLALIASLRNDRVPIAIVPIVDEAHQDLFASAVAAGADDVLMKRGASLVNVHETLARIRQSPHLTPTDLRRRLHVLYAGRDTLVWNLIEQIPFVKAERVNCGIDGSCPVRAHGSTDGSVRCDAVVIDEAPGEAHPLQVLKSVKAQASDLPVVVLTSAGGTDVATAALELGADDTVLKTGIFRRRLIATLRRVYQRLELQLQHAEVRAREERLRQIVEHVPTAISVVAADGAVLAINAEGLRLFGATKPREVVGRDVRTLVAASDHQAVTNLLHQVTKGEPGGLTFQGETLAGEAVAIVARAAVLERDAKGGRGMIVSLAAAPPLLQATDRESDRSGEASAEAGAEVERLAAAVQRLEQERAALEQERDAEAVDRRRLQVQLEEADERLEQEREGFRTTEQALASAAAQLAASHARSSDLEHGLETLRHELRAAREQLDRARTEAEEQRVLAQRHERALAEAEQRRHDLDQRLADAADALARERTERRSVPDGGSEDRERREALEHERQQLREAFAAIQADYAGLAETLAAERTARERDRREIDALRATIEREDALRADMDARMAQSNQDAATGAQLREADLIERCQRLEAQLSGAEARLRAAEVAAPRDASDSGLEEVGALANAMMPDLEALVTALMGPRLAGGRTAPARTVDGEDGDALSDIATQAGVLIRQLAAFGRRQAEATAPVDVNQAIGHAEPMLAQLVGPYVGFEVRLGASVTLQTPQTDLDHLLTSLVIFGRDALPAGGSLVLETAPAVPPDATGHRVADEAASRISLTAMGYGARCPTEAPAVELVARRCGGRLRIEGEEGWRVRIDVSLPEHPRRPSREWTWLPATGASPTASPGLERTTGRD